jgi:hypothetical protein
VAAQIIEIYQGVDWSRQLGFFYDEALTLPYPIANPIVDLRDNTGALLASFQPGASGAWITQDSPGYISLHLDHATSANIPAGTYPIDVFADVDGVRMVLAQRGAYSIKIKPRITQDPA